MNVKKENISLVGEELEDDLPENIEEKSMSDMPDMDDDLTAEEQDKLAALKARVKGEEMPPRLIADKKRSYEFGVIGSGQAGSKIASVFAEYGYTSVVINTAQQDLASINLPDPQKLLLDGTVGGSAKDIDLGEEVAEMNRDAIYELVHNHLSNSQILVFCLSLGGGSGAGSCNTVIDILQSLDLPIIVITVLPMDSEDAQTKHNALQTLSKLSNAAQNGLISNLIVVDNAKIESVFSDVGQFEFYKVANKAIVEPLHNLNVISAKESEVKGMDSMEWGLLMTEGGGLSCYGTMYVDNYEDEMSFADAVLSSLKSNLLADGFDLSQARYVGLVLAANANVWKKIPSRAVNYALTALDEHCSTPKAVFKGMYVTDDLSDSVRVYSVFSGLGLPDNRVKQLTDEAKEKMQQVDVKDRERNLTLNVDTGNNTISQVQAVKNKIKRAKSNASRLNRTLDRRKK